MARRKGIKNSGKSICLFYICTLNYKNLKSWTESYFILFVKLKDHPTQNFNFGLRRIDPNGCKFELVCFVFKLRQNPSKN